MIVAINIDSLKAKKYNPPQGNIRIDNKTRISNIEDIKTQLFNEPATKIEFIFVTTYNTQKEPIGEIEIIGNVIFRGENEKIKETWLNEKKLPDEIAMPVMNSILRKSITKAIDLSEELMLPPPINLPLIHQKKQQQEQNIEYIG